MQKTWQLTLKAGKDEECKLLFLDIFSFFYINLYDYRN